MCSRIEICFTMFFLVSNNIVRLSVQNIEKKKRNRLNLILSFSFCILYGLYKNNPLFIVSEIAMRRVRRYSLSIVTIAH